MSIGNRDVTASFALVMVIGLVWALGVWAGTYYEAQRTDYKESEAEPYHGTLDRSTFWQERAGSAQSYKAICGSPIDESQADLCQQWRSANAAEQMAGYALVSLLFGLAGLIGVGFTVYLSNKSTDAATKATEAAVRSANAAEKAYLTDNRPWIRLDFQSVDGFDPLSPVEVYVTAANVGKGPAVDARIWVRAFRIRVLQIDKGHVTAFARDCVKNAPHNTFQSAVILPGVSMATRQDAHTLDLLPGEEGGGNFHLGVIVVCTYRGGLSEQFFHSTATALIKQRDGQPLAMDMPGVPAEGLWWEDVHHVASIE